MRNLMKSFWSDERGFVVTAEVALLATMGVVGATVGIHSVAKSVDGELREVSRAFRKLDQSYSYRGYSNGNAATAGSAYQQPPVEKSFKQLRSDEERLEREQQNRVRAFQERQRNEVRERESRDGKKRQRRTGSHDSE